MYYLYSSTSINVSGLRKLYEKLYHESERHEDYKDFGSIKLIDYILQKLSPQSHKNGQNIIGPLYLVNDFRTILDHSIGSNEKRLKNNILKLPTSKVGMNIENSIV